MGKDPAMLFYVNDWLASPKVAMMSLEQQGAYMRLLCFCWASGDASLPDDDGALAALSGLNDRWVSVGGALRACFEQHPDKSGFLTNMKVYGLWEDREKQRKDASKAGKASAEKRKKQREGNDRSTGVEREGNDDATEAATEDQREGNLSYSKSYSNKTNGRPVARAPACASDAAAETPPDAAAVAPSAGSAGRSVERPPDDPPPDARPAWPDDAAPPLRGVADYRPLHVGDPVWFAASPLMLELWRAVDPTRKPTGEDRRLAIVAAVVASTWLPPSWLREVIASYQRLSEPPRKRWAWIRKALQRTAGEWGLDWHKAERAIEIPEVRLRGRDAQPA